MNKDKATGKDFPCCPETILPRLRKDQFHGGNEEKEERPGNLSSFGIGIAKTTGAVGEGQSVSAIRTDNKPALTQLTPRSTERQS
ncbi:MAG: hypothetical protein HZA90_23670 [Verrucomicrobia bacterium]|nr:hypothetical protein [Verrucomicrobiota bacterium]